MNDLLRVLWHVPVVMATLLAAGLLMGQRNMGELSIFDLLTGIAIGAVAGSAIIEPALHPLAGLGAILALGLLHYGISWLSIRWRPFGRAVTFEPLVVIRHGKPIKKAMRLARVDLADLLPMLREKDIFDLREVEYGVLEGDGGLSVLKAAQPPAPPAGLPRPVVLDGQIDRPVLQAMGWNEQRLRYELAMQGHAVDDVFLATLDEAGHLYATPKEQSGPKPLSH